MVIEPKQALRFASASTATRLPPLALGPVVAQAGEVALDLTDETVARAYAARIEPVLRAARRAGARLGAAESQASRVLIRGERAADVLLALELLRAHHVNREAFDAAPGPVGSAQRVLERLDRALATIAERLEAPSIEWLDSVGAFVRCEGGATHLTQELGPTWSGWIGLAAPLRAGLEELAGRLGVPVLPALDADGGAALLVAVAPEEWAGLAPRLRTRAARFLALLPERDALFASVAHASPEDALTPKPFDPEAVLAALPAPSAPGSFDVELRSVGPDAARTAALLARAAGMTAERAAALVARVPARLLTGVSAHVARSIGVALVRGAAADVHAAPSGST